MANLFSIIGQHKDDPDRFLLIAEDGQHYSTDVSISEPLPVQPGDDYLIDEYVIDFDDVSFHEPSAGDRFAIHHRS
jgi:hypothetical protein